jgi:hypothetical protein
MVYADTGAEPWDEIALEFDKIPIMQEPQKLLGTHLSHYQSMKLKITQ